MSSNFKKIQYSPLEPSFECNGNIVCKKPWVKPQISDLHYGVIDAKMPGAGLSNEGINSATS